jgi:hypothetical protein
VPERRTKQDWLENCARLWACQPLNALNRLKIL